MRMPALSISIERITYENARAFKAVRLRALLDAPHAFGSTYERESKFSDAEWLARIERSNGDTGVGFLAMDDGVPCGIAGALLDIATRQRAELVSMWIAPSHRRRGAGRLLVSEVCAWTHSRGLAALYLMVTSNNQPAICFYEQLGFQRTGRTAPYPNDPSLIEYEMSRPLP